MPMSYTGMIRCSVLTFRDCHGLLKNALLSEGPDIEKGWYRIPAARAASVTDAQMAQRPTLASRMARLRGFADTGYAFLCICN